MRAPALHPSLSLFLFLMEPSGGALEPGLFFHLCPCLVKQTQEVVRLVAMTRVLLTRAHPGCFSPKQSSTLFAVVGTQPATLVPVLLCHPSNR